MARATKININNQPVGCHANRDRSTDVGSDEIGSGLECDPRLSMLGEGAPSQVEPSCSFPCPPSRLVAATGSQGARLKTWDRRAVDRHAPMTAGLSLSIFPRGDTSYRNGATQQSWPAPARSDCFAMHSVDVSRAAGQSKHVNGGPVAMNVAPVDRPAPQALAKLLNRRKLDGGMRRAIRRLRSRIRHLVAAFFGLERWRRP
jgi:hypothetical protein